MQQFTDYRSAAVAGPSLLGIPGMEVAARHQPGARGAAGDFVDVLRLAPNAWGMAVGDVCGTDGEAARRASRARDGVWDAARRHALPSDVLGDLNHHLAPGTAAGDGLDFCALVFARLELDMCGAWVTLASAGHPRPIVVRRAGWIDVRGQAGTPAGMFPTPTVTDDRVGLGPGDAVVFCTDGVTGARNNDGELFGEEGLPAALLAGAGLGAEAIADQVLNGLASFAEGRLGDDAALLVVRVPDDAKDDSLDRLVAATGLPAGQLELPGYPVGDPHGGLWHSRPLAPREARISLAPAAGSVPATRRFLVGVLRSWRMPEVVEGDVELLASELSTNAVRHADSTFTVIVRYDGAMVRVEVGDGSRAVPSRRAPEVDDPGGRGIVLVEALSSKWGVTPTLEGKRVWFEVPAQAGAA
ncbi:MAG: ATP-binding SpoIIE family protein phosphatase [Acidimicrobiales bacterium]